jgi:tetratricopeptide (TPR) repeat protein
MTQAMPPFSDPPVNLGTEFSNPPDLGLIALLVCLTLALYTRTGGFDFIHYDDQFYVTDNVHVLRGLTLDSLKWAMTTNFLGNWHPLTLVSELVIVSLFGPSAAAFHLTNALLHTLSVVLLFLFVRRGTGRAWPAFFAAGLWGLHPLRAESVAWVSELKDVLCGLFCLACLLAYLRYSRRRTATNYVLVVLFLILALLSKPMAVTLPAVLLLTDFWPLRNIGTMSPGRWWQYRILEKLPLLALSLGDTAYSMHAQSRYLYDTSVGFSLQVRCFNALVSYGNYLRDIFLPYNLVVFYPHPATMNQQIPVAQVLFAAVLLLSITGFVLARLKRQPCLAVGWFWFLGMLVPVIGLIQAGDQARADRYTYLPSIGITLAVVFFAAESLTARWRVTAGIAGSAWLATLAVASWFTIGHWRTTDSLFGYVQQVQPGNYLALSFECDRLTAAGQLEQAISAGRQATQIAPSRPGTHVSYGLALRSAHRLNEALQEFKTALAINPRVAPAWDDLGSILDGEGNLCHDHRDGQAEQRFRRLAVAAFQKAIACDPDRTAPREHLAMQLAMLGRMDDAIAVWEQTVAMNHDYAQAQGDLADALNFKGDPRAVGHYRAALAAGSRNPAWESTLAFLIATSPQATAADVQPMVDVARDACEQTGNRQPAALDACAACLARVGRFDDAAATAQKAVEAADAAGQTNVARGIRQRLARYQKGQPYIAGADDAKAPSSPLGPAPFTPGS